jgi:transposase InsO family protein
MSWLLKLNSYNVLEKAAAASQKTLKPIVSSAILEGVQVDLIDFSNKPDCHFKYVLHIKDHFNTYTALYACREKTAAVIREHFAHWLGLFRLPKVVQSDNGGEIKGMLETLLCEQGIQIVHGRAKHPQSQGLVEQSNLVAKRKLEFWQARTKISSWVRALPFKALAMNKQSHSSLPHRMSPYEAFLGRKSRWESRVPQHRRVTSIIAEVDVSSSEEFNKESDYNAGEKSVLALKLTDFNVYKIS